MSSSKFSTTTSSKVRTRPPILAQKRVAIVGGGPAGVLAAAQMARLGARVDIFEKASGEFEDELGSGWIIGLADMAKRAIEDAGLSAKFPENVRCVKFIYMYHRMHIITRGGQVVDYVICIYIPARLGRYMSSRDSAVGRVIGIFRRKYRSLFLMESNCPGLGISLMLYTQVLTWCLLDTSSSYNVTLLM
jgi:hypothetical protein